MPLKVGDECSIGGKSFTVTEVGQMTELYLNDLSSIKVGMEDLSISFDSIVTSEILDKTQKEELESILKVSNDPYKNDTFEETYEKFKNMFSVPEDFLDICINMVF